VQVFDLRLCIHVRIEVGLGGQSIVHGVPVQTHEDDWRLERRHAGEHQIKKNEWEWIERRQQEPQHVYADPDGQHTDECDDERPAPGESRYVVRKLVTEAC
jgi:hypothetical protein